MVNSTLPTLRTLLTIPGEEKIGIDKNGNLLPGWVSCRICHWIWEPRVRIPKACPKCKHYDWREISPWETENPTIPRTRHKKHSDKENKEGSNANSTINTIDTAAELLKKAKWLRKKRKIKTEECNKW